MKKEASHRKILQMINHWIVFFLLAAFVITCCMLLFISTLSSQLGIVFTEEHINTAAKLTFANVVFLSILFTVIDSIRRWFAVDRPVKKIIDAAEKIAQGDFSVRVQSIRGRAVDESFNRIIDCFNFMAEELSGTETLRTDFIANVSHELKTPLSVMQNYGTMLMEPGLSEEKRIEYSKAITDTSRRLASLITNILKLNKLENQQIFPQKETFDLGEQLCECLLNFERAWAQKEFEIDINIEDSIMVSSDAEMLTLVWNNLFSNAIKFTPDKGRISLSLTTDCDYAVVSVSDTGCGISREVGQHIFEKFYQGDTSHSTQGNGLGLALVKRVMDIIGGEISVESEVGQGSTFTVRLKKGYSNELEEAVK